MKSLSVVAKLSVALTKRYIRDPLALFFTFAFPLIFLFIFGLLFRDNSGPTFDVALINHSQAQFSQDFVKKVKEHKTIKVKEDITTFDQAKERMGRGELDSILELPREFGQPNQQQLPSGKAMVYYEEGDPQAGQSFATIVNAVFAQINQELTKSKPPFSVEQKATKTSNLTPFDYTFSGLLGFALLSLGIFGTANGIPIDKKTGALRRIRAAPVRAWQYIIAQGNAYMIVGVLVVAVMFVVALIFLDLNMRGDYLTLLVFSLLATILVFGIGLAVSGWAKNENQAAPLSNLVAFPMIFLSGSFFPRFLMPQWLQDVSYYLPLTPVIDGFRYILTESRTLLDLGPQLAIIGIWIIIVYVIAFKTFRWE